MPLDFGSQSQERSNKSLHLSKSAIMLSRDVVVCSKRGFPYTAGKNEFEKVVLNRPNYYKQLKLDYLMHQSADPKNLGGCSKNLFLKITAFQYFNL